MAGKAALSGAEEGTQEVAETVSARTGVNSAAGPDVSTTEGTFGGFILGALGGAPAGAIAGIPRGRQDTSEQQEFSESDGSAIGEANAPVPASPSPDIGAVGLDYGAIPAQADLAPSGPIASAISLAPDLTPQPEAPSPQPFFPDQKPGGDVRLYDSEADTIRNVTVLGEDQNGIAVRVDGMPVELTAQEFDAARDRARQMDTEAKSIGKKPAESAPSLIDVSHEDNAGISDVMENPTVPAVQDPELQSIDPDAPGELAPVSEGELNGPVQAPPAQTPTAARATANNPPDLQAHAQLREARMRLAALEDRIDRTGMETPRDEALREDLTAQIQQFEAIPENVPTNAAGQNYEADEYGTRDQPVTGDGRTITGRSDIDPGDAEQAARSDDVDFSGRSNSPRDPESVVGNGGQSEPIPELTTQEAEPALNGPVKFRFRAEKALKRPFTTYVQSLTKGIDPKGSASRELRARGVTPMTAPRLFRIGGAKDLDNYPKSEHPDIEFMTGGEDQYLDQGKIIDLIADEVAGNPVSFGGYGDAIQNEKLRIEEDRYQGSPDEGPEYANADQDLTDSRYNPDADDYVPDPNSDISTLSERFDYVSRTIKRASSDLGISLEPEELYDTKQQLLNYGGSVQDLIIDTIAGSNRNGDWTPSTDRQAGVELPPDEYSEAAAGPEHTDGTQSPPATSGESHPDRSGPGDGNADRPADADQTNGLTPESAAEVAPPKETTAPVVAEAARDADGAPTDAQKEAGNYRKGHARWNGLDLTIENAKGSERSGKSPDGNEWSVTMPADYGYFKGTEGADGDHVDFYMGPNENSDRVFVVDQSNPDTGEFDEHKVMLGFDDKAQATAAYDAGFSDGRGPQRRSAATPMTVDDLKKVLSNKDQWAKPLASQTAFEAGAEGKPQAVIPGAEASGQQAADAKASRDAAEIAVRQQQSKIRKVGGNDGDAGPLFSDGSADLFDGASGKEMRSGQPNSDENPAPATTLSGNELGPWENMLELQRKARAWYKDNIQGQYVKNTETGWDTFDHLSNPANAGQNPPPLRGWVMVIT